MTMEDVPRIAPELQAVAAEIGRRYRSDDFQTMVNPSGVNNAS
jgi:hypothetical protein